MLAANVYKTQYNLVRLDHSVNGCYVAIWDNPVINIRYLENKIEFKITINMCYKSKLPYDFFLMNVVMPQYEINDVRLYINDSLKEDLHQIDGCDLTPYTLQGTFYIDTNESNYLNGEIWNYELPIDISVYPDSNYFKSIVIDGPDIIVDELISDMNKITKHEKILINNIYTIDPNAIISITQEEKFYKGKSIKSKNYNVSFSKIPWTTSFLKNFYKIKFHQFEGSLDKSALWVEYIDLLISNYNNQKIKISGQELYCDYSGIIGLGKGYDYNIYDNKYYETNAFAGINIPWSETINITGKIKIKLGTTSFYIKINDTYERNIENRKDFYKIVDRVSDEIERYKKI